jgi:hypothetical protein
MVRLYSRVKQGVKYESAAIIGHTSASDADRTTRFKLGDERTIQAPTT